MSATDLYISNGTCFFGRGQVADPNFIPCGNAVLSGPQSCCYVGDYCLSGTACWDNNTVVTYIAGCTDSTFTSAKCTNKFEYPDQQWVALARCEGDELDLWSGCSKHTDWIAIEKEPDCACNASRPLIRNSNGKSSLDEIASLPPTAGGTISFNPSAIPTLSSQSARSSISDPTNTSGTTDTPSLTASPSVSTDSQGLSTGGKIGVGVGVGLSVPLIGALIFLAYSLRRRKENSRGAEVQPEPALQPQPLLGPPNNQENSPGPPEENDKDVIEAVTQWPGYKPELHADDIHKSELAADELMSLEGSRRSPETHEDLQISELSGGDVKHN